MKGGCNLHFYISADGQAIKSRLAAAYSAQTTERGTAARRGRGYVVGSCGSVFSVTFYFMVRIICSSINHGKSPMQAEHDAMLAWRTLGTVAPFLDGMCLFTSCLVLSCLSFFCLVLPCLGPHVGT